MVPGSETLCSPQIPDQLGGVLEWEGCRATAGIIANLSSFPVPPEPTIHQGLQHPQMLTLTYFVNI